MPRRRYVNLLTNTAAKRPEMAATLPAKIASSPRIANSRKKIRGKIRPKANSQSPVASRTGYIAPPSAARFGVRGGATKTIVFSISSEFVVPTKGVQKSAAYLNIQGSSAKKILRQPLRKAAR